MHYTEQVSWILFLKFLDDYEQSERDSAELDGCTYTPILDETHTWSSWTGRDGRMFGGDDLKDFVNTDLFPYLK